MALRNEQVVEAWSNSESARNDRHSLHTDGSNLYSYKLLIGFTSDNGNKVVLEHRAPHFVSHTTSCHVGLAALHAHVAIHPGYIAESATRGSK
jgi:hypothetical protein